MLKTAVIIENAGTEHVCPRVDGRGRVARRHGDLHDRRLRRGTPCPGPDLQRVARRPRAARQEGRRLRDGEAPERDGRHLHDRLDQLAPARRDRGGRPAPRPGPAPPERRTSHVLGGRAGGVGRGTAGRQRLEDALRDRPRRQPPWPRHPRRHHPGPARPRAPDDAPLRRRRHGPDGRPGAPDARRRRARDGPPARPRARSGRRLPRQLRPPLRRDLHRDVRRPRHPPGPLLLDERHLPDGRGRPVHPDRARPGAGRPRRVPARQQGRAPRRLAARPRRLPRLRQGGNDDRHRLGRPHGRL